MEEKEEEEVAAEVDVEATAGPREAAPFPLPRCEAAVSSLTSASRLLVGFSPPAGVAAAAAVEGEVRRGRAARKGRVERGGSVVSVVAVGLALGCLTHEGADIERALPGAEAATEGCLLLPLAKRLTGVGMVERRFWFFSFF